MFPGCYEELSHHIGGGRPFARTQSGLNYMPPLAHSGSLNEQTQIIQKEWLHYCMLLLNSCLLQHNMVVPCIATAYKDGIADPLLEVRTTALLSDQAGLKVHLVN